MTAVVPASASEAMIGAPWTVRSLAGCRDGAGPASLLVSRCWCAAASKVAVRSCLVQYLDKKSPSRGNLRDPQKRRCKICENGFELLFKGRSDPASEPALALALRCDRPGRPVPHSLAIHSGWRVWPWTSSRRRLVTATPRAFLPARTPSWLRRTPPYFGELTKGRPLDKSTRPYKTQTSN